MQNEILMLPLALHALRSDSTQRVAKCWLACLVILILLDLLGRSMPYKAILLTSIGGADGRLGVWAVDWVEEKLGACGAGRCLAWLRAWCWLGPLWIIQAARRAHDRVLRLWIRLRTGQQRCKAD